MAEKGSVHHRGGHVWPRGGGRHGERVAFVVKGCRDGEGGCMVKKGAWVVKGISMAGGMHGWWGHTW